MFIPLLCMYVRVWLCCISAAQVHAENDGFHVSRILILQLLHFGVLIGVTWCCACDHYSICLREHHTSLVCHSLSQCFTQSCWTVSHDPTLKDAKGPSVSINGLCCCVQPVYSCGAGCQVMHHDMAACWRLSPTKLQLCLTRILCGLVSFLIGRPFVPRCMSVHSCSRTLRPTGTSCSSR